MRQPCHTGTNLPRRIDIAGIAHQAPAYAPPRRRANPANPFRHRPNRAIRLDSHRCRVANWVPLPEGPLPVATGSVPVDAASESYQPHRKTKHFSDLSPMAPLPNCPFWLRYGTVPLGSARSAGGSHGLRIPKGSEGCGGEAAAPGGGDPSAEQRPCPTQPQAQTAGVVSKMGRTRRGRPPQPHNITLISHLNRGREDPA